jgi:hypothetical protein
MCIGKYFLLKTRKDRDSHNPPKGPSTNTIKKERKREVSSMASENQPLLPLSLEHAHLPAHIHEHETTKNITLAKAGRTPYSTAARPKKATRKLPASETTLPPAPFLVAAGAAARLASEVDELAAAVEVEESVLMTEASVWVADEL